MPRKTIFLSAGGTGGHLFPAEALAAELVTRGHKVVIVTDKRGNAFKSLGGSVEIHTVRAGYLKPGMLAKIRAVADMGIGIVQSAFLLLKYKPAVIIGFGGYPSFPAVFAGQRFGIPTILHEQNAVLGKANAWLAHKVTQIATAMPGTQGISAADQKKVVMTGNPVRKDIISVRDAPYHVPEDEFRILVTGGSQASKALSDVIPEGAGLLPDNLKKRLYVSHQCREADLAATQEKYKLAGVRADIRFFFNDMASQLKDCHLFIGRSGASTVTEIAVAGRPAIFVPDPRHADLQQKHNAEVVTSRGGGWVMMHENFTPAALAEKMKDLMDHPEELGLAAAASKACGRADAAQRLADVVEKGMRK